MGFKEVAKVLFKPESSLKYLNSKPFKLQASLAISCIVGFLSGLGSLISSFRLGSGLSQQRILMLLFKILFSAGSWILFSLSAYLTALYLLRRELNVEDFKAVACLYSASGLPISLEIFPYAGYPMLEKVFPLILRLWILILYTFSIKIHYKSGLKLGLISNWAPLLHLAMYVLSILWIPSP